MHDSVSEKNSLTKIIKTYHNEMFYSMIFYSLIAQGNFQNIVTLKRKLSSQN